MIKQNIKAWIIQWLTILLVLALWGVSYAAFTTFTALEAAPNSNLTADKWNNLVDAVKDEYSTTETLTNKVYKWKPVYRKIININVSSSDWYNDYSTNVINPDIMRVEDYIYYMWSWTVWESLSSDSASSSSYMYINNYNIRIFHDWAFNSQNVDVIVEYTKTTDIAQ